MIEAASSAVAERTGLVETCAAAPTCACPNAPKSTFANDRFIALHMITERMNPEDALIAPATISSRFPSANPIAAQAAPANEFNSAITVGMSPPPIGMIISTPNSSDSAVKEGKTHGGAVAAVRRADDHSDRRRRHANGDRAVEFVCRRCLRCDGIRA